MKVQMIVLLYLQYSSGSVHLSHFTTLHPVPQGTNMNSQGRENSLHFNYLSTKLCKKKNDRSAQKRG